MRASDNPALDIYAIQNYIRVCASKANLTVKFGDVEAPQTVGGVITLPTLNSSISEEDVVRLTSYVNHVASHYAYNTDFDLAEKYGLGQMDSELGLLWGIFEDTRVDRHDYKEWYGDGVTMESYYDLTSNNTANVIYSLYDALAKQEASPEKVEEGKELDRDQIDRLAATLVFDNIVRSEWMGTPSNYTKDMVRFLSSEAEQYVAKFVEGEYADKINSTDHTKLGSKAVKDLAGEVYREIFQLDEEEELERMEDEAKGEGDDGGNDGESGSEGSEGGSPDDSGVGEDDPTGQLGEGVKELIKEWDPFQKQIDEGSPAPNGMHLVYPEKDDYYGPFKIADDKDLKIMDYVGNHTQNIKLPNQASASGHTYNRVKGYIGTLDNHGAALANKVRRLLQIKSRSTYQYGQKKGKIDGRNVYRVTMKDAPGFNERVFKRKVVNDTLDVAVTLLVDFSGSMHGEKVATAIHSSLLLQEAISRSLRVPLEILGFTDYSGSSALSIFKTFDMPVSSQVLQERMLLSTEHMSSNADGEAIAWANARLGVRTEKRRIMIVLSDGSPATGRSGNIDKFTKEVIEGIEKRKNNEIVGIGIMDTNVQRLYKSNYVIHRVDELEEALLHVIERKLL